MHGIRRRDFIRYLGSAGVAWPLAVRAQQPKTPVIGFLNVGAPTERASLMAAFREGLRESSFIEGQNVAVEYRWAEGKFDRLAALAGDLVRRQVSVIAALGSAAPGRAAQAATSSIPIVFQTGSDPVQDGLVTSLNRPGGNVTGVSRMAVMLGPKLLSMLHELVPKATTIAFLVNSTNPIADRQVRETLLAARSLGLDLRVVNAGTEGELESAFGSLSFLGAGALMVANDPFFTIHADQLVALAARYSIPASYPETNYVALGGLMSYGASLADSWRQAGVYVGRILKGETPADLPVMQPTKFDLALNLTTAKALGLTVPNTLFALANEVIE